MEKEIVKDLEFCDVKFQFAKSAAIIEREIHDYHELLFYIDGEAGFRTEKFNKALKPKTLIFIPKGKYHLFTPKLPQKFTRLKISFRDGNITKRLPNDLFKEIKISEELGDTDSALLLKASELLKNENEADALYLYGAFLTVLSSFSKMNYSAPERKISTVVSEALEFIGNNLEKELSIKTISKELGVSSSLLSHEFKREIGITPHSYVTQKRLLLAKNLLKSGKKPSDVFSLCGYRDYSSFYKAYTKAFAKRPKDF